MPSELVGDCAAQQSSCTRDGVVNQKLLEAVLTEIQDVMSGRPGQHLILSGGVRTDRPSSCGRDDPKTENADTRAFGRSGLDGGTWVDADPERELYTRCSWTDPGESSTQMHFIMTWGKLEARRVQVLDLQTGSRQTTGRCLLFVSLKTKNEIRGEKRCELAWLEARRHLAEERLQRC